MATYVLVRHQVEDYDKWKPGFDAHGAERQEMGSRGARVFRVEGSPNEQIVITEWPDSAAAHAFAELASLRAAMQNAGVVGRPDVYFLEEADNQPA